MVNVINLVKSTAVCIFILACTVNIYAWDTAKFNNESIAKSVRNSDFGNPILLPTQSTSMEILVGDSVDVSKNAVIIGAPMHYDVGAAYIYKINSNHCIESSYTFLPGSPEVSGYFGCSVTVSNDGRTAAGKRNI